MTLLIPFGYAGLRLTPQQLALEWEWYRIHPEVRERLMQLFVDTAGTIGMGGGARSESAQRSLFLSRYYRSGSYGEVYWEGFWWRKRSGVAAAAPPGRSWHEDGAYEGYALAADLIPPEQLGWVGANAWRYRLHDFSDVNGEAWHVQPVEVPNGRSDYIPGYHRLGNFVPTFPPTPGPIPPPKEQLFNMDVKLPIIRLNARGRHARRVQALINARAEANVVTEDGWYGARSAAIIKWAQGEEGLTPDGIVGPKTWRFLIEG